MFESVIIWFTFRSYEYGCWQDIELEGGDSRSSLNVCRQTFLSFGSSYLAVDAVSLLVQLISSRPNEAHLPILIHSNHPMPRTINKGNEFPPEKTAPVFSIFHQYPPSLQPGYHPSIPLQKKPPLQTATQITLMTTSIPLVSYL